MENTMNGGEQFILLITFVSLSILIFAYLLLWINRRKNKKAMLLGKVPIEEDTYNQIQIVKSMANVMEGKGYDVGGVRSVLHKADIAYADGRYGECLEIVNNAKRMLMRIRNEEKVEDTVSPHVERELEIIKNVTPATPQPVTSSVAPMEEKKEKDKEEEEMPPQVKDYIKKLPPNYLQSKFEIGVVEEKIPKKEDGEVKEAAKLYLVKAKEAFDRGDYTAALKFAVRSNKILDTNQVTYVSMDKIGTVEEKPPAPIVTPLIEEKKREEEEELRCPKCGAIVRPEDKYCWNCGAKLVFVYTCPNCGAEVTSEDKYCRHCGYKLR